MKARKREERGGKVVFLQDAIVIVAAHIRALEPSCDVSDCVAEGILRAALACLDKAAGFNLPEDVRAPL